MRRLPEHLVAGPDKILIDQYLPELAASHSWSNAKAGRNGLQFFWKHIRKQSRQWLDIAKASEIQSLTDILTPPSASLPAPLMTRHAGLDPASRKRGGLQPQPGSRYAPG